MKHNRSAIVVALIMLGSSAQLAAAGDLYWSPAPSVSDVNDIAVCDTTVYVATATGLFRSQADPESWEQLRSAESTLVACSGSSVFWEETVGPNSVVYVSHDALQTATTVSGLDDAISRGIRDLAIAGNTALVATLWGVDRSTDGGLNFPAAYPVLWESSAGYQITAVWTNGTACAAAGSGGFAGSGIWYSGNGAMGTWSQVLDVGGQAWLDGFGNDTVVSGSLYSDPLDTGYISTDAGATWTQLPTSWGAVEGHYQRPFVSGSRILSRHVWEEFDPGSGLFITRTDGPFFYEVGQAIGNDMDPGLPSEEEILNQAIVEGPDPFLLVAMRNGDLWWFRCPGGWPTGGFDFTPPLYPTVNTSPRIDTQPPTGTIGVSPHAVGAQWMYLQEEHYVLEGTFVGNNYTWDLTANSGPTTGGWTDFAPSLSWTPRPGAGTHTLYAWFADTAGNITDPAVQAATTLFPQSLPLAEGQLWGTLMYARAGESFTIGGAGTSGDIDVYHWEPGSALSDDWAATWGNDTLSFTADETGYHVILIYNYPGAGSFDGSIIAAPTVEARSTTAVNSKPAANMTGDPLPEDPPGYYQSALVAPIFADGFEDGSTSQWGS